MSVVSVNELDLPREGEVTTLERRYIRAFQVITDDNNDGPIVARAAPLIDIGFFHPDDFAARVVRVTPQARSRVIWTVTIEYTTLAPDEAFVDDPLERKPQIIWSHTNDTKAIIEDQVTGEPIANSSGEPFDPIEVRAPRLRLTLIVNRATFDPLQSLAFIDRVNSAPVTVAGLTVAADQAKIVEFSARNANTDGQAYFSITFGIEFATTFRERLLDEGFSELVEVGGNVRVTGLLGNKTVAAIDLLGKANARGDSWVLTSAGVLTRGGVTVAIGDVVQWVGTHWGKFVLALGGFVPSGVRLGITTTKTPSAPYGIEDAGKIVSFDGANNTGTLTGDEVIRTLVPLREGPQAEKIERKVKLNGKGRVLQDGLPAVYLPLDAAGNVTLGFFFSPRKDFAPLNLPTEAN